MNDLVYVSVIMTIFVGIFVRQLIKCLGLFRYDTEEAQAEYNEWLKKEGTFRLIMAVFSLAVLLSAWIWFAWRSFNS